MSNNEVKIILSEAPLVNAFIHFSLLHHIIFQPNSKKDAFQGVEKTDEMGLKTGNFNPLRKYQQSTEKEKEL